MAGGFSIPFAAAYYQLYDSRSSLYIYMLSHFFLGEKLLLHRKYVILFEVQRRDSPMS